MGRSEQRMARLRSAPCGYKRKSRRDAVDRAYLDKYNAPGALKYVKDLARAKSRATTIELVTFRRFLNPS